MQIEAHIESQTNDTSKNPCSKLQCISLSIILLGKDDLSPPKQDNFPLKIKYFKLIQLQVTNNKSFICPFSNPHFQNPHSLTLKYKHKNHECR